jgi:5-methylcytosine-specific restriction endonuclease McrA
MNTLILTPDYQPADFLPLSVIDWQSCIRLLWLNKIKPVHLYENRWIHSPRLTIQLPAVAVTTDHFVFKKGRMRFSRQLLFLRDLFQCAYCSEHFTARELSVDHVIPRCEGGKTTWTNTVTSCKPCNLRKGHKRWRPNYQPFAPDYYALAARRLELPMQVSDASWLPYLRLGNKTAAKIQMI